MLELVCFVWRIQNTGDLVVVAVCLKVNIFERKFEEAI